MSVTIVWGTMLALQPAVLRENAVGEQLVLLMSRLCIAGHIFREIIAFLQQYPLQLADISLWLYPAYL